MTTTPSHPEPFAHARQVTFNAHIDFITVESPGRIALPEFDGTVKWPRSEHSERFTIHDPSDRDLAVLAGELAPLLIKEIEVSVDIKPRPHLRGACGSKVIESVMIDVFASCLAPSVAAGASKDFRACYRRLENGYKVAPFNYKLPLPTDQQLHGGRWDDIQTKAYYKRTDNRRKLADHDHVARVEVALRDSGPSSKGLITCADLIGYPFRKKLMPLFRHVRGAHARKVPNACAALNYAYRRVDHEYDRQFAKAGCGAFVVGGNVDPAKVRLGRHCGVNHRIGQALSRLEQRIDKASQRIKTVHFQALPNR